MTIKPCIEDLVMAHRYLYYVRGMPVLPDPDYDKLEQSARKELPETSPVHGVGSDSESSYTEAQRSLANLLFNDH